MDTGYQLPEELKMLQTWVRNFVRREIIPLERAMDPEDTEIPEDDYERLSRITKDAGMWCLGVPEEYGGGGLSCFAMTIVQEEMAQHRNGLYNPGYGVFGRPPPGIIFEGTPEQIQKYAIPTIRNGGMTFYAITEPSGGSDPGRAIQATAVRHGDDWILNGTKVFITGAGLSDWGVVFARTGPG